jgi:hypothetical protein
MKMIGLSKTEDSKGSNDFQTDKSVGKPCRKLARLRYNALPTPITVGLFFFRLIFYEPYS